MKSLALFIGTLLLIAITRDGPHGRQSANSALHFAVYRFRGQFWYPKRVPTNVEKRCFSEGAGREK